jgi:hypothetical protein
METNPPNVRATGLPHVFWLYLAAAALVAAGFAGFPLVAYHFERVSTVPSTWVPVFYAMAMGVSGTSSLIFGHLFDRIGIAVLIPLTLISALFPPLVFLGRLLGGPRRHGALEHWHWRARIDRARGGGAHGTVPATCIGLRPLHGRVWRVLISWQRADRHLVRYITAGGDRFFIGRRTRGGPAVHPGKKSASSRSMIALATGI